MENKITDKKYCVGCGGELHKSAVQCPKCGAQQNSGKKKSKIVAGWLAFLLGGLGIHRFYLGQWIGVLYILFIWTFIPAFVALVEAIYFWTMSKEKFDEKYNV